MRRSHQSHAALLQLIAEGMRSSGGDRLNAGQRHRIAGLLDHIAVDLLVPSAADDGPTIGPAGEAVDPRVGLPG